MGSLGFMPFEVLTSNSLIADASHDVFAVAALLLLTCASLETRRPNLFTHEVRSCDTLFIQIFLPLSLSCMCFDRVAPAHFFFAK